VEFDIQLISANSRELLTLCYPGVTQAKNLWSGMRDMRITKKVVDSLKATDNDYVAWDADLPGFGIRVRPSGAKSYIAVYRSGSGRKAPLRSAWT
jgi:hypothetical protein